MKKKERRIKEKMAPAGAMGKEDGYIHPLEKEYGEKKGSSAELRVSLGELFPQFFSNIF